MEPNNKPKTKKKFIVIGVFVTVIIIALAGVAFIINSKNKDSNNTSNNENTADTNNIANTVAQTSYPTDVCPDEIIYGQGLPIGVWNGVEYQVTDDQGIQWLDNTCKPLILDKVTTVGGKGWQFENDAWVYKNGTPPDCPSPLLSMSPANVSKATSILYPGQTRGQYKPHGGFRFDNSTSSDISVTLPITARLVGGAKYTEGGDIQYLLDFVSDCGIAIRFDHLHILDGEFKTIGDSLPLNPPGDTRGQFLEGKEFKAGTLVASAVGMPSTNNTGFDFGVYDYRTRNEASKDPNYVAAYSSYSSAQAFYALCWLDLLPASDASIAKSLPGGDAKAGKQSDYCK